MGTKKPLKFKTHNLTVFCYDASDVRIDYAGRERTLFSGKRAPARTPADENRFLNTKSGTYPAFAGPFSARWRSRDGTEHACALQFDDLFPEREVLHRSDPDRICDAMPMTGGAPTIVVEIDDRKVGVSMDVELQLDPVEPARARDVATFRTRVFEKTF